MIVPVSHMHTVLPHYNERSYNATARNVPFTSKPLGLVLTKEDSFLDPIVVTKDGYKAFQAFLMVDRNEELVTRVREHSGVKTVREDRFNTKVPRKPYAVVLKGMDRFISDFKRFDSEFEALEAFHDTFS